MKMEMEMTKSMTTINMKELRESLARTRDFVDHAVDSVACFVKMGKDGQWTYGTDELEIYDDSEWAVNPFSFATGYSAFDNDGNRIGEEMRTMQEPPVLRAELANVNGTWSEQIGFGVKCLNTEDKGLEGVVYQRSRGGLEAAKKLLAAVLQRVEDGEQECVAVVALKNESYKHPKYGKIYKPVLSVVRWVAMEEDGTEEVPEQEKLEAPEAAEQEPAKKTRTRAKKVEQFEEVAESEDPAPRRRRPRKTA